MFSSSMTDSSKQFATALQTEYLLLLNLHSVRFFVECEPNWWYIRLMSRIYHVKEISMIKILLLLLRLFLFFIVPTPLLHLYLFLLILHHSWLFCMQFHYFLLQSRYWPLPLCIQLDSNRKQQKWANIDESDLLTCMCVDSQTICKR